jgi:hypothetical protein
MADRDLFSRLRRLFSTNVIVRNVGGRQLKIADTQQVQSIAGKDLVDRYSRLYKSPHGMSGYNQSLYQKTMRLGLFRDYEAMDSDPLVASALDIYADETTLKSEYGDILTINSDNNQIHDILHNLYYDILNIEFNLYPWTRNLCKYGDFFLKLDISEKFGITNVEPLSSYDVNRVEGEDPENPYYTKFVLESGDIRQTNQGFKTEFENYEIAHFRMISDSNFLPYGRSMLEGGRKVWKQLSLMEDAMLIHRIMRAPEKRIFNIDIGNIPPAEVDQYMQKIVGQMKKAPVIDENSGQYNLKYNIQNITEDFFLPVRGGDSGTKIENLAGLEYQTTEDIEYLRNKLLASLKIPQPFYGYAEKATESKATLAAEDVRFARTIERIQRILVSELTKIGIVHLYSQGYTDADLVDFDIELTNPSKIYEQEKLELLGQRITAFNDLTAENSVTSKDWAYKQIFGFSDEEIKNFENQIVEDKKTEFRYESIKTEGNDPKQAAEQEQQDSEEELASRTGTELGPEGGSPEGGWEGAGRPKEMPHYGKDGSARGRDPLGKHDRKKASSSSPKYGKAYRESLGLDKLKSKVDKKILNEAGDVETEYKNEVSSSISDN